MMDGKCTSGPFLESDNDSYTFVHVSVYTVEMRQWLRANCSTKEWFIAVPARVLSGVTTIAMLNEHAVIFKLKFG